MSYKTCCEDNNNIYFLKTQVHKLSLPPKNISLSKYDANRYSGLTKSKLINFFNSLPMFPSRVGHVSLKQCHTRN